MAEHKGFILGFLATVSAALGVIAIKSIIATWPFWAMVAAIGAVSAAIGLLVDDFITFMEGGESCIGRVMDLFYELGETIINIGRWIKEAFIGLWNDIGNAALAIFDSIVAKMTAVFDWIITKWKKIKEWIPFLGDEEEITVSIGKEAIESTQTPLSTMKTSNFMQGGDNSVRIDNISVNTQATDAHGISVGIGSALTEELNDVLLQNTGGALA